jgi:hypothetical protein
MTVAAAHTGTIDWTAWKRLFLAYNLVMFALAVPVVVYGYRVVHSYLDIYRSEFSFSWSLPSVVLVCLAVAVAANLVMLLGPLAELVVTRVTARRPGRWVRRTVFGVWLAASILVVAYIWFAFWTLPIALM